MTDVIRHGRQEPLLPGRNEAAGVWQVEFGIDLRPDQVDAIREALKDLPYPPPQPTIVAAGITLRWQPIEVAAAPAEGLAEPIMALKAWIEDTAINDRMGPCSLCGGKQNHLPTCPSQAVIQLWHRSGLAVGYHTAALARHESGSE